MKWYLLAYLLTAIKCQTDLKLVSKSRTTFLERYGDYSDVVLILLEVPKGSSFASFKFTADETVMSFFGCSPRKVSLYMKHNSPPVINPDGSKFPDSFKNVSRPQLYQIELDSDKAAHYINLTSPEPGSYFVATFLPYTDPKQQAIQPPGLTPKCFASVDAVLLTTEPPTCKLITEDSYYETSAPLNDSLYYKFFVPVYVNRAVLTLDQIHFSNAAKTLLVRVQGRKLPSNDSYLESKRIESNEQSPSLVFSPQGDNWHYAEFIFVGDKSQGDDANSTLRFRLRYHSKQIEDDDYALYGTSTRRIYRSYDVTQVGLYRQYDLIRASTTESLSFTFDLRKGVELSSVVAVNISSAEFTTLKFHLRDSTDVGGALQFILAYKPRIKEVGGRKVLEDEPEDHRVVGCVNQNAPEYPIWPDGCSFGDNGHRLAPILLNKSVENSSVQVPFPEAGVWYASFRLFCGECEPCRCTDKCQQEYRACVDNCEITCSDDKACNDCPVECRNGVVAKDGCKGCDCDGPCLRSGIVCNSSMLFDVSSYPCVAGGCGKNGRCTFMVSDGVVYSTCVCTNNYRGWDCSDDSQANPYWLVVLELLLLVLSNLMFLPAVYVAYRRQYYVEALVYSTICFFSIFYHACDAGENIISFCMTRLGPLQFADFFCALLSIWVTLIAMANLPSLWPNLLQIVGAIVLAFITTINKTSVWVFAVPAISGLVIIAISWYFKYRKVRQMFLNRRYAYVYLPIGLVVVIVSLIIFALLQTASNYMYLHSLWHMLMATAVVLILPRSDTFQPETML